MTDWDSPVIIISEYGGSFIHGVKKVPQYPARLTFLLQLHMSRSYMSRLAYTCEHMLILTHTRNFSLAPRFVHEPVGRSSRTSVSITPSSSGNGSFACHFWYAFITTSGGIEPPSIEG